MSAFLGPIHYWLYNKIKIQNNIVEDILDISENSKLRDVLYEQHGDGELKPLDEVIDVGNIHGWLQNQIIKVETKLAFAVTDILEANDNYLEKIKKVFYDNAVKYSPLNENSTIEEAFKAINDTLLDGMPCDHVNAVVKQDEKEAVWKRYECVHSKFWSEAKGDIKIYYILRDEFIRGLLERSKIGYEKISDDTYKISRS